jgi:hypothetical protein
LNGTARRIYLLCDGSHTLEEIVRAIVAEFSVEESTARSDAAETVQCLAELDLVSLA